MPKRIIAPPTTRSVRPCPIPQKIPVQAALPAHDRGHGDDMIGIGRVAHPEEEAEEQNGKKIGHGLTDRNRANPRGDWVMLVQHSLPDGNEQPAGAIPVPGDLLDLQKLILGLLKLGVAPAKPGHGNNESLGWAAGNFHFRPLA